MNLENELRAALQRKSPRPDLGRRVMAHVERRTPYRAIAAALLMTAVLGGWTAREIQHRREGERARQEVLVALRITTEKLRTAQQYVHDIGSERQ